MTPTRALAAAVLIAWLVAVTSPGTATAPASLLAQTRSPASRHAPPGAEVITEAQLRAYLTFLASDLLEGRETPSRGLDTAAAFLASQLSRWGLTPAGDDGSFLQRIALTRRRIDLEHTALSVGTRALVFGDDFLPGAVDGIAEGRLVYIGHGYVVGSRGIDPYRDLDVRDRIVIAHPGLPAGVTPRDLKGPRGKDWNDTAAAAAARGARGVLFLPDYAMQAGWPARRDALLARGAVTVDAFEPQPAIGQVPTATLSTRGMGILFAGEKVEPADIHARVARREPAPAFALSGGKTVRLAVGTHREALSTSNVVALLEGSDPVLTQEYVALGAHYDHLGTATRPDPSGDTVYNGADDDGSGSAGVLAIAEAAAKAPTRPRRSMLFVWHTGEEKDLWGSRYFVSHPAVPLDRIIAQLNIDMIGRSRPAGDASAENATLTGPDSVYVIGSRLMSSDLGVLIDRVNDRYLRIGYDYRYADPADPDRFFYRSDHYEYAKRGIPIVFYFTGVHEDYHGLDDEVDRIDFRKMRRITQTIHATAWELANVPVRPRVNTPRGDELTR